MAPGLDERQTHKAGRTWAPDDDRADGDFVPVSDCICEDRWRAAQKPAQNQARKVFPGCHDRVLLTRGWLATALLESSVIEGATLDSVRLPSNYRSVKKAL